MELDRLDIVRATFHPLRTDDLKPWAARKIGQRALWQASWIIERGPYAGQWAMHTYARLPDRVPDDEWGWTPLCDLADVEIMERMNWSAGGGS